MSDERIEAAFVVPESLGERRLDQVAAVLMPEHSRARIQSWIKRGELTLNDQRCKPRDKVHMDDRIRVDAIVEGTDRWVPEPIGLDIVFEDEDIIVLNKPAGMVVHPAAGHGAGTLLNALLAHAPTLDRLPRAGIVHRLDKETSGVMVVARSLKAHTALVAQLQSRTMGREYHAVVVGALTGGGRVDAPIGRHPQQRKKMAVRPEGKSAVTEYRLLERFAAHSHVLCRLETGRTHQIRVHMAHIRHPLVGDPVYGGRLKVPPGASDRLLAVLRQFQRQALHARRLRLCHPASGETLSFEVPLPEDMQRLLEALREGNGAQEVPL